MKISLTNAGKRFNREWIYRGVTLELTAGNAYAITGPNGSGKSTLLQAIGGMLQLSEGSIGYESSHRPSAIGNQKSEIRNQQLGDEEAYKHISFCAPYLDVIEEMTLTEFLEFHRQFKPLLSSFSIKRIVEEIGLEAAAAKQIRYYSSGMKQRVKLAQAIFSDTAIVLLDEPCSNLDAKGIALYHSLISNYCKERLVIVCSNDPVEYSFCETVFSVTEFKKQ
ncbi:ABC transporter ATP-binding protein [Flavisolibacter ginsenosidimutans]|uniref:ATP-binding cassette domain-containing protein n=1 Tax=Flavisolibacter ginsenosidimutans TaxID=661481 RepID=A0A5B8UKB9_9BACT|nr:ATP-binding cassette domain-containing protein [Flavisolibacter ginsenosidimutans]QEC57124.1 ATP-binding cassette domain-containing protein [Flavisolibacter ginsenosidimutans]